MAGWVESLMPAGDLRSLLVDGVLGGVGGVVVFLPQIVLLFFFIGLLESSGYMARAAFLMDGVMARAGLSGKAFLPLFSSYACAIPGVMATRTIDSAKERLVTIFIAPWMSCSARLPVYFLIVPLLLHENEGSWKQALVLFAIYTLGTLSAFVIARVLRRKLGPDPGANHFLLELPPYRAPQWSYIFRHVLERGWSFVAKAGTIILGLSILLWALSTYPKSADENVDPLSHSAMGRIGAVIEPVVKPLGFDGRIGTAILTSFAAREVFNSSLAVIFRVEAAESDEETRSNTRDRICRRPPGRMARRSSRRSSLVSLLVFFIYALQCLPTSAVVARESGSWKWALGQFALHDRLRLCLPRCSSSRAANSSASDMDWQTYTAIGIVHGHAHDLPRASRTTEEKPAGDGGNRAAGCDLAEVISLEKLGPGSADSIPTRTRMIGQIPPSVASGFSNPVRECLSILLELAGDQLADRVERGVGVRAFATHANDRAMTCGQHHQAHDALAVHFLAVLFDEDIRLETIRRFDELRGGPGVDAEFVEDREFFLGHGKSARRRRDRRNSPAHLQGKSSASSAGIAKIHFQLAGHLLNSNRPQPLRSFIGWVSPLQNIRESRNLPLAICLRPFAAGYLRLRLRFHFVPVRCARLWFLKRIIGFDFGFQDEIHE